MTFGMVAMGVTTAVGVGLSAASAAGAFNGEVDKFEPTPEELEAAKRSRELFQFGQGLQRDSDKAARQDLKQLQSPAAFARSGGLGSDQAVAEVTPTLQAGLQAAGQSSGGPGSGRWASQLGTTGTVLDAARREGNARGRTTALQKFIGRKGQYLERLTGDVETGMGLMEEGANAAQQRQAERINAQVGANMARGQAMGQIGGALTSVGMAGLGGGFGAGGAATSAGGAAAKAAGQGVSVMKTPAVKSFDEMFPNLRGY